MTLDDLAVFQHERSLVAADLQHTAAAGAAGTRMADLLSATRKCQLGVLLSQQYTGQTSPAMFASVMGNVGTLFCFRIGASDVPILSRALSQAVSVPLLS